MERVYIAFLSVVLALSILISNFPAAFAQEEFTLEEVTVTAQKREENMQKTAIAMEVISADTIKELGRTDIEQILQNMANVFATRTSGAVMKITVRGIANDQPPEFGGAQASTPTVAMNFDGISTTRTDQGMSLFDIERVEVLFGPQSTLYSSNTPGGIVNVITGTPKLDMFEGSGSLEYGTYNHLRAEGMMNAPLSDTVAVRGAFYLSSRDGYNDNGTDDEDAKTGRLRVLFQPNERFNFIGTGELLKTSNKGFSGVQAFVNQDDVANPWTAAAGGPPPPPGAPPSTPPPPQPTFETRTKLYGQMNANIGIGTVTFLPSYVTRTNSKRGEGFGGAMQTSWSTMRERSMEIRMASNEDLNWKYIMGLSYYRVKDNVYRENDDIDSPIPGDVANWGDTTMTTDAKAAYGNVTIPVSDQFRFTLGLRTSEDDFHSLSLSYPPRYGTYGDPPGKEEGTMSYSGTDYKIGLEYDVGENAMLFTDYSTSYRTQGMMFRWPSDPNQLAEALPPEKLKAFNLGYKSRFFGNKFQFNVATYYYDYQDYAAQGGQPTVSLTDVNGDGIFSGPDEVRRVMDEQAKSTGDARVYGVDVSASMIITPQDKLDVTISSNRKYFTKMYFDYLDVTNTFVGIPDKDLSGWPMTYSPELTVNGAYSHNFNLENGDIITARIDAKYQSEYLLDWETYSVDFDPATYLPNPPVYTLDVSTQEPHYIANIAAVYADAEGKWTFTAYMKNIANYAAKLHGRGGRSLNISAPRTYGAILTIRY